MTNSANKKMSALPQYYNRFDESNGFDETLFLAGRGLQSAELNELQSAGFSRIQGIGDALFQEGDVISGAQCVMDAETGKATIEAGKIYLQGAVRSVAAAQLTIPLKGTVQLGVYLQAIVVTELDDPSLRDPALGCRNYQEAGAARLRRTTAWTYEVIDALELESEKNNNSQEANNAPSKNNVTENNPDEESHLNDNDQQPLHFYPIYRVVNGVLVQHTVPPQSDAMEKSLARYDYEGHGHYVIDGLTVRLLPAETNTITDNDLAATDNNHNDENQLNRVQTVMVSAGKAHVNGFTVQFSHPLWVDFPAELEVAPVLAEPHPFVPESTGKMTVNVHHAPVAAINRVEITQEKTVTVTHGIDTGAVDALPDTVVMAVLRIAQGAVVFSPNTDYRFEAGRINWSMGGKTPLSGSQYSVLCEVRESVTPESVNEAGFCVQGAVKDSLVLVDYTRYLPRIDAIVLNHKGDIQRLKGTSSESTLPIVPRIPAEVFALAFLHQTGSRRSPPRVENSAVQRLPMGELQKLRNSVQDLYGKVAELVLGNAASQETPAVKKGLLVDAFLNESVRDAGVTQTAALIDGCLTLPILERDVTVTAVDQQRTETELAIGAGYRWHLPFTLEPCLEQALKTLNIPLHAKGICSTLESVPAQLRLTPPVDRWVALATVTDSPTWSFWSQRFSPTATLFQSPMAVQPVKDSLITEVRPLTQSFGVSGFSPKEVGTLWVDGQCVKTDPAVLIADSSGDCAGTFTWPVHLPSGSHRVQCRGDQGHCTESMYVAKEGIDPSMRCILGQAVDEKNPENSTPHRDAMAQTFTLPTGRFIGGVELSIGFHGNFPLTVQLREVQAGKISANVLAQTQMPAAKLEDSRYRSTRFVWPPVWLEAHREYALTLNGLDKGCLIGIARCGVYANYPHHRIVMLADLKGGTFFNHGQERKDTALMYRLLAARFTKTTSDIHLGQVTLKEASNVILLLNADRVTPTTQCRFRLIDSKTQQVRYSFMDNTPAELPDCVSGTFELRAQLTGTATESPVIYSGIQFA